MGNISHLYTKPLWNIVKRMCRSTGSFGLRACKANQILTAVRYNIVSEKIKKNTRIISPIFVCTRFVIPPDC